VITFTPIASSSAGCCYRVSSPGAAPLLLDAGVRYRQIQEALDFKVSELAGCLISHAHGDHCKAARDLMNAGVYVWASIPTWEALGLVRDGISAGIRVLDHHRAMPLVSGAPAKVGEWTVMPFEVPHDVPGTLGFYVLGPQGDRLLYLTDCAYSPHRFEGLTHLAIECNYSSELIRAGTASGSIHSDRFKRTVKTHMSLERLIDLLKANDLSKCEEIHLLHLSDENSDEEAFRAAVIAATGIPTYVAPREARKQNHGGSSP
jgi:phosphoribosyl 1,2-cyclic phosphodiesterase